MAGWVQTGGMELFPEYPFVTSEAGVMGMHYIFKIHVSFWGRIFNYFGKTLALAI